MQQRRQGAGPASDLGLDQPVADHRHPRGALGQPVHEPRRLPQRTQAHRQGEHRQQHPPRMPAQPYAGGDGPARNRRHAFPVLGQQAAEARHHPHEDDPDGGNARGDQHRRVDHRPDHFLAHALVVFELVHATADRLGQAAGGLACMDQLVEVFGYLQRRFAQRRTETLAAAHGSFHVGERAGQARVVAGLGQRGQRGDQPDPGFQQGAELMQHQLQFPRRGVLAPRASPGCAARALERIGRQPLLGEPAGGLAV